MEQLQTENSADGGLSDLTAGLDAGGKNAHIMRVMTSSDDMTWATPQEWFDYLNLEFGFTLDPCCWPETAKCKRYYTPDTDGLAQSWQDERVFMNPPYGKELGKWMKKAYEEARDNGRLWFVLSRRELTRTGGTTTQRRRPKCDSQRAA